jgi:hypothetical protein
MTTYAHLARFARYAPCGRNIPGTQDEPLGFASLASAARLMHDILMPIPFEMEAKKVIIIRRMLGYGREITIPSPTYLVIVNVLYG